MKRIIALLLGIILGLFCGFCHAEATFAVEQRPVMICESKAYDLNADLEAKYQEWRQERIELLAWLIMRENGLKDMDCKLATGATALNREADGRWGDLKTICSSSAYAQHYNGEPNEECWEAAEWLVDHPDIFPSNMFYFREGKYHSWATDWNEIDGTYFSTDGEAEWK